MSNKPEWLLKAEEEIANFAKTKIGKMDQKEFEFYEKQVNAGKSVHLSGKGIWAMDKESLKAAHVKGGTNSFIARKKNVDKWDEDLKPFLKAGGKKMGPIQGKKNVESGLWAKCAKLGGAATKAKNEAIKKERYDILLPLISSEWFTRKSKIQWFMDSEFSTKWNITSGQFMSTLLSEDKYFETKGNGRSKLYKKKQN
jgi:hypothetical protein